MPMQTGILAGKLGEKLVKAHNAVKDTPVKEADVGLPGGINGGVAKLRSIKFGEYKEGNDKGKPFCMMTAVVVKPTHHDGQKVEGLQTRITFPLYDTPNRKLRDGTPRTFQHNWDEMLDNLGMLAGDMNFKARIRGNTPAEIEAALLLQTKALEQAGPCTRFRTWKGPKQAAKQHKDGKWWIENEDGTGTARGPFATEAALKASPNGKYLGRDPFVNHYWGGLVEFSANGDAALADAHDDTGDAAPPPPEEAEMAAPGAEAAAPEVGVASADNDDLGELVAAADRGDKAAILKVQEHGAAAGLTEKEMEDAANYAEIADLIRAKGGAAAADDEVPSEDAEGGDDESPPAEEWEPTEGEKIKYQMLDKAGEPMKGKNGKVLNPIECEIVKVDKKAKTVNLTAVKDKSKHYNNKAWDNAQIVRE